MRQSFPFLLITFLLAVPIGANALSCGGLNQAACKAGKGISPCNKNLRDVRGKCVKMVRAVKKRILQCGALNQRLCTAKERIPACNKGLVENTRTHRCVRRFQKIVAISLTPQRTVLARLSRQNRLPIKFRSTLKQMLQTVDRSNKLIANIAKLSSLPKKNHGSLKDAVRQLIAQQKRMRMLESIADQAIDEAKNNVDEAKEQFKQAMRILSEHMERMTQVTQKITS